MSDQKVGVRAADLQFNRCRALVAGALLTAGLAGPALAQAPDRTVRHWTGAEILDQWTEMSHDGGPHGAREYEVVGDSLRWVAD
ncbi:MAG: hypothetical protein KC620_12825, partial [Myxococcales bacterium]|nr:hypothetical protein [Myxococcales bacterium]